MKKETHCGVISQPLSYRTNIKIHGKRKQSMHRIDYYFCEVCGKVFKGDEIR